MVNYICIILVSHHIIDDFNQELFSNMVFNENFTRFVTSKFPSTQTSIETLETRCWKYLLKLARSMLTFISHLTEAIPSTMFTGMG